MKFIKISLLVILVVFFMVGCASMGINKKDYDSRIEKVKLGMTKSEFKKIFPESVPRRAKQYPNGTMEVLEVSYVEYYAVFPGKNQQWFCFYNDKLLQYGDIGDWPTDPDLIIKRLLK
jgi:hypothetical protein